MPSDARFTPAGKNIWLLPTRTGGPGNAAYKRGGMEFYIATLPGIRKRIKEEMDKAYAKAQAKLAHTRAELGTLGKRIETGVRIDKAMPAVDGHIILTDMLSGTPGAMSIELGRSDYVLVDEATGKEYVVGGMTGKGFLHAGFGMKPGDLHGTGGGDLDV